jgi:uncharacterized OB-fold protein
MADVQQKFLPPADMPDFHRPFWDALKQHRLELQSCDNGHLRFIPTEICPACGSEQWSWKPVSGRGTIYSYTVVHRGPTPAYQADAPYIIVHIELEEGPRLISNLLECDPAAVAIGMPVEVTFLEADKDWTLYYFLPRKVR